MSRTTIMGLAAAGLFAVMPAQAAIMQSSSNVYAGATAVIITGMMFDPREKDEQANLKPGRDTLNASVSVVNQDGNGDRAFDHEDVFANFSSTASGTVDLSGASTSLASPTDVIAEAYNSGSSFNYDFTLTSNYTFNVQFAASDTDSFYYNNYYQLIRTSGGAPLIAGSPVNGSFNAPTIGQDSAFLTPGSYEFGVTSSLGDISSTQGPGLSSGAHIDQYDFSLVSDAPEPSTWLLLSTGMGGIGLMLRRTKRNARFRSLNASAV